MRLSFCYFGGGMKDIELCMTYDTCKRCPAKKRCDEELRKQKEKHKRKDRDKIRKFKRGYYD